MSESNSLDLELEFKRATVLENTSTERAYNIGTEDVVFGFGFISCCTGVYLRGGNYAAVAHMKGLNYSSILMSEIKGNVTTGSGGLSNSDEFKVYFSVGVGTGELDAVPAEALRQIGVFKGQIESESGPVPVAYFLYDSNSTTLYLDSNGNPTSTVRGVQAVSP